MGQEALCTARFGDAVSDGKALLEPSELLFRGDFRLKIPFAAMRSVEARQGRLEIVFDSGTAIFDLGPRAEKWAERILHPPTLLDKLGVQPDSRVAVVALADDDFKRQLRERLATQIADESNHGLDFVFFQADEPAALERLGELKKRLKPNGAIWVVSPKGKPEIKDVLVMAAAREAGLVDVKVASFSASHTALKLVIPRSRR